MARTTAGIVKPPLKHFGFKQYMQISCVCVCLHVLSVRTMITYFIRDFTFMLSIRPELGRDYLWCKLCCNFVFAFVSDHQKLEREARICRLLKHPNIGRCRRCFLRVLCVISSTVQYLERCAIARYLIVVVSRHWAVNKVFHVSVTHILWFLLMLSSTVILK